MDAIGAPVVAVGLKLPDGNTGSAAGIRAPADTWGLETAIQRRRAMGTEDLKKLNERFNDEVFRRQNINAIDELLTDDFVEHTPAPGQATDRQGAKDFIGMMLKAFPDIDFTIDSQIAEGDMVSSVGKMTGTHQAPFMGVPATGKKISIQVMDTGKVRDGKFAEHWGMVDVPAMMTQLGVPAPA
jgi:steroid delta-isomerase-like uncharacterized protein